MPNPKDNPELYRKGLGLYVYFVGGKSQGFMIDVEAGDRLEYSATDITIVHGDGSEESINFAHVLWRRVLPVYILIPSTKPASPAEEKLDGFEA